jgi:regulator of sigma E protease
MIPPAPLWLILLAFLGMISVLVFFHELGHYLVARLFGIPAETFSIGFGREILGWTDKQGTRWKVAWLPLGGYVKFIGDMTPASTPVDIDSIPEHLREHAFQLRPVWQRFFVVLAGPLANFLLAILIFTAVFSFVSAPETNKIGRVEPKSAAAAAGLQPGDRILAVAGHRTTSFEEVRRVVERVPNEAVPIEFERGQAVERMLVTIGTDQVEDEHGNKIRIGLLGVSAAPVSVFKALPLATQQTARITGWVVQGVVKLIIGEGSRKDVGGPIRIAQFAGQAASLGALPFVQLLALLSINLGFINLLPVPLMDGGHLFFYGVEAIRRRPLSERALEWAFRGGLAVILALVVFTTINDLGSIGLWDRLQRLIG